MSVGVVIVGAGFGGIGLAIRLKQAGFTDFVVLERATEVGGTWRDNTYPGCACDIPSQLYSFSFAPKADWSSRYPPQPEIQAYLTGCVDRFGLRPHLRTGCELTAAAFDPRAAAWQMELADGSRMTAAVLVLAQGALSRPAIPPLPGIETFAGRAFHSAGWDHGFALDGKRVGVIGTGASAIQFVPAIASRVGALTLFQRTPAWILPKRDPPASAAERWVLAHVPLARRALRAWIYWTHEARAVGFTWWPRLMQAAERRARSHAKRQLTDGTLRERLTPEYRMGCKRVLLSSDFLPALNRPNVELVTAPIERVAPAGIVTADGRSHALDAIIYATGFKATDPFGAMRITGPDGADLRGPHPAYLGLGVAGFPNLFLLGGPNTGLGHNSIVFMLEAQIDCILRRLRQRHRAHAALIEVDGGATARYQKALTRRMDRTVWLSGCRSWYLDAQGRNTTLWPGFSAGYWLRTRLAPARAWRLRRRG